MKTKTSLLIMIGLLVAALAHAGYVYPRLPDSVPIHWNLQGNPDQWGSKALDTFLAPGIMAAMILMALALPVRSPKNFKIEPFMGTYNEIMTLIVGLFGYIHVVIIQAASHPQIDMGRFLIGGILLFFAAMGNLMGRVRRNFWMGIRTPWTLASDAVWVATHRLAGRLMVVFGLLGAVAVFAGVPPIWTMILLIAAMLYPCVHSFILYKQMERAGTV
jgi:uncharacterized membrane protein